MLHPIIPFITEYLHLTCFPSKKSILLETWPEYHENFVDKGVEQLVDKCKEVISLSYAARMKAALKRRWPLKQAIICVTDLEALKTIAIDEILKNQLNVEQYKLVEMKNGMALQKIQALLDNQVPIAPKVSLVKKNVAQRLKSRISSVITSIEKLDMLELIRTLQGTGKYTISYDNNDWIDLFPTDLEFSYVAKEGYVMSERDDLIVFLETTRDKQLIMKGLLRDLSRNLQQLRKERGYNPTEVAPAAYIAGLQEEEITSLCAMEEDFAHLVRVKMIFLSKEAMNEIDYKNVKIDERVIQISVQ